MDAGKGIRLFVGGSGGTVQGERCDFAGDRCFSAVATRRRYPLLNEVRCLLDSGAFSDKPEKRLSPECALHRQMEWERNTGLLSKVPEWQCEAIVSYDLLIDETWVGGVRYKQRWSLQQAESAVETTIEAARFLAFHRERLAPRRLVLACQGVDARQYCDCTEEILTVAKPGDWIGLGGWCILGRIRSLLPEFWRTLYLVLPRIREAGIGHVHIFGVMWPPALGGLLWLADQFEITVSADSSAPVVNMTRGDEKKAGVRRPYWRDNVAYWVDLLANIRETEFYKQPPYREPVRQLALWD